MTNPEAAISGGNRQTKLLIRGARCAVRLEEPTQASIEVTGSRIAGIHSNLSLSLSAAWKSTEIDLDGFLIFPGLVNAHDHLDFALFPRLANPPYQNYIDWGIDIHNTYPDVIATQRSVPKELRVWWGGIRNLLCGATTVSHHNPFRSELARDNFPIRVIREYGWGHSYALGGDIVAARSATPKGYPFIMHACEGIDDRASKELGQLDGEGILDAHTVLVHGLAMDREGVALMRERGVSLIVCPSSNYFLFGKVPDLSLLGEINNLAIGNDSPLTATGDLLDEVRFAIRACNISPQAAYRMVTEAPAAILRLRRSEGSIMLSGIADLIAVRDSGVDAAERFATMSMVDIEFVMLAGQVQLASKEILDRLPSQIIQELEPLSIGGTIRWLRAPVRELLRRTEQVLGSGQVRLGGKPVSIPHSARAAEVTQSESGTPVVERI
ncbi:amidohydrolase family protein [Acidicapsa acidisoli]|uniref:amidohydrolase family protein n=1 Tax=Acidicapsa acidisoli TaxID=1615681 RepID=UPI0021E027A9|nr:amidohydrolase family protein [Acidicapsa acidisoli]